MYLSVINRRFERVIEQSFSQYLLAKGYERKGDQFYFKSGRVSKLVTVDRDLDHTYYRQVAIFTIRVDIISEDFWEMSHPDQAIPIPPFQGYPYSVFKRHLGRFYGKERGDQWLALDATIPEQTMIDYLRDLLLTHILPYLDQFNSLDDILNEYSRIGPSHLRMRMLARLGRQEEAHTELKRLIASRHQLGFRINMVKVAQQLGII